VVVNLIEKKDSGFFNVKEVNQFSKIKINLTMQSLLGVAIDGIIELYFTNPQKIEKSGHSKYNIISSHFEVNGMPKLVDSALDEVMINTCGR